MFQPNVSSSLCSLQNERKAALENVFIVCTLRNVFIHLIDILKINPSPTEPGYVLPLQTVWIQISWLLKPTDLDLHCLPLSM